MVQPLGTEHCRPLILMIDVFHVQSAPPYFFTMAPNLQFSMQAPHLMHLSLVDDVRLLDRAGDGVVRARSRAQAVQPLHLSAMIS